MRLRPFTAALPIATAAALALAGCGGGTSSTGSTSASSVPDTAVLIAVTTTAPPTSTPVSTVIPPGAQRPPATSSADGAPTTAAGVPQQPGRNAPAYDGKWQRHESALTLNPDRTGSILIGANAVDVETWSLTWEPVGGGITMVIGDRTQKSGAGLNGYLAHGQTVTGKFATGGSGITVLQTHGTGTDDSETLSWCKTAYGSAPECGA